VIGAAPLLLNQMRWVGALGRKKKSIGHCSYRHACNAAVGHVGFEVEFYAGTYWGGSYGYLAGMTETPWRSKNLMCG